MDRIRLIHTDDAVVGAVENIVRQVWGPRGGIQEVSDKRPLCYELKLKGYPWWCYGKYYYRFYKYKFFFQTTKYNLKCKLEVLN